MLVFVTKKKKKSIKNYKLGLEKTTVGVMDITLFRR